MIKTQSTKQLTTESLASILISSRIFYTLEDAHSYVTQFGILINNNWYYSPNKIINLFDIFSLNKASFINNFFKKKKKNLNINLKRIRFYKFRVKYYTTKKKFNWIALLQWLDHNKFVQLSRDSSIEFDFKIMTGVFLKKKSIFFNKITYSNADISYYMNRSYSWKYLT